MRKSAKQVMSSTPQAIDIHIGMRLRAKRNEAGLTQEELGKALADQLSHQQIQKYERGENSISCFRLVQLAETLKVNASYFLDDISSDAPQGFSEAPAEPFQYQDDVQKTELNKAFSTLPNGSMKKAVVDFIKIVSSNIKSNDEK
jgi:transcriptional regulator with XRE-family HTH domain